MKPQIKSFVCSGLTSSIQNFLIREASQTQEVACYLPAREIPVQNQQSFPPNITIHPLPLLPDTLPHFNYYEAAEGLVSRMVEQQKKYLPSFFRLDGYDFENLFRYQSQLSLSTFQIGYFKDYFNFLSQNPAKKPILLDFDYLQPNMASWTRQYLRIPDSQPLYWDSTLIPMLKKRKGIRKYSSNLAGKFKTEASSGIDMPNLDPAQPTALVFLSGAVHLEIMKPALNALKTSHNFVFMLTASTDFTEAFCAGLQQYQPAGIIHFNSVKLSQDSWKAVEEHFDFTSHKIDALWALMRTKLFLMSQVKTFQQYLHVFYTLERIIQEVSPNLVLGCMELNLFGPAFSTLQQKHPFKTLNFQHGNMNPIFSFHLFNFDLYCIWNDISKKTLLKDHYAKPESLALVHNPFLNKMKQQKASYQPTAIYSELLQWKGESKLLAAYSTFQATHLTLQNKKEFIQCLVSYALERPDVKLLIKKHPNEQDNKVEEWIEEALTKYTALKDRIRVMPSAGITLLESFLIADVATAICSTVLQDALHFNIPAVAIDFDNIHEMIDLMEREVYPVITDPTAVPKALDQYLFQADAQKGLETIKLQMLSPHFEQPDEAHFEALLKARGLIPTESSVHLPV